MRIIRKKHENRSIFEVNNQKSCGMLVEFSVENFRSIAKRQTLSMEASSIRENPFNVIGGEKIDLLKSVVIYGANSSGKSNLIRALSFMRWFIINSIKEKESDAIDVESFSLSEETIIDPSLFEVTFILDRVKDNPEVEGKYRYGFEVTKERIITEWLFLTKKNTEKPLFIRDKDKIQCWPSFKEGKNLEEKTGDNVLFLSIVSTFKGKISEAIIDWFKRFPVISGLTHENVSTFTYHLLKDDKVNFKKDLLELYKKLNLGFSDIVVSDEEYDSRDLPRNVPESVKKAILEDRKGKKITKTFTTHDYYEGGKKVGNISFDLRKNESAGTNKIFNISGAILLSRYAGGIMAIDELDASIHPLITCAIVELYNNKKNKRGQLIFTTHDTNLLSHGNFRRDQIYFMEKDQYEASNLYSLVEYKIADKKIRGDERYQKNYIEGRYGAIPYIGGFNLSNSNGTERESRQLSSKKIAPKGTKSKKEKGHKI